MPMKLNQILDASFKRTRDGYLAGEARVARSGIQLYSGDEVGSDKKTVRVYRPPEAVFTRDAMRSYAHRPITVDHAGDVTAENWSDVAKGHTGGDVVRDGDYVRVPMMLMDAEAIKAVENGKRELSMGYSCDLEFADGVTPDGEQYDAIQSNLRMNHLAIVSAARGGSNLCIGDEGEPDMPELRKILIDGIPVEVTQDGATVIQRLQDQLAALHKDIATRDARVTELTTAVSTKDGEIVALKKQVEDGKLTPAKLDDEVKKRSEIIAHARAIMGDGTTFDGRSNIDIMRAAVVSKIGDEATKSMNDDAVGGAFRAFVGVTDTNNPLRSAIQDSYNSGAHLGDRAKADKAAAERNQQLRDGWKQKENAALRG